MPTTIVIQNHLQYCPWSNFTEEGQTWHCFSANIGVGFEGDSLPIAELRQLVLPWMWEQSSWEIRVIASDNTSKAPETVRYNARPTIEEPDWLNSRKAVFENEESPEPFRLPDFSDYEQDKHQRLAKHLVPEMMEMSRLPQPVPASLSLAAIFWLPDLLTTERVVAAPQFSALDRVFKIESVPTPVSQGEEQFVEILLYQGEADQAVRVCCRCLVAQPNLVDTNIVLSSESRYGRDRLEGRHFEEMFFLQDLPRRLIDFAQKLPKEERDHLKIPREALATYLSLTQEHFLEEFAELNKEHFNNFELTQELQLPTYTVDQLRLAIEPSQANAVYLRVRGRLLAHLSTVDLPPEKLRSIKEKAESWPWRDGSITAVWVARQIRVKLDSPDDDAWTINGYKIPDQLKKHIHEAWIKALMEPAPVALRSVENVNTGWRKKTQGLVLCLQEKKADFDRVLSSYGVLLRQKSVDKKPWSCLHLVDLRETAPALEALVPFRPSLSTAIDSGSEELKWTIAYNNSPLSSEPVIPLETKVTTPVKNNAPVLFKNIYKKDGRTLPRLEYGTIYQAHGFRVGPAGNLPPLLWGDFEQPWVLKRQQDLIVPDEKLQEFVHRRDVRVGHLTLKNFDLPTIPDTVHPLCRSLRYQLLDTTYPYWKLSEHLTNAPLVLLHDFQGDENSSFSFSVAPPACDLTVWEQSVHLRGPAAPDKPWCRTREVFATALGAYYKRLRENQKPTNVSEDVLYRDPWVAGFRVRAARTFPFRESNFNSDAVLTGSFLFDLAPGSERVADAKAIPFTFCLERSAPEKRLDSNSLTLAPGEVWLVQLYPVLHANGPSHWFLEDTPTGILSAATTFVVEAATEVLPTPSELWRHLRAELDSERYLQLSLENIEAETTGSQPSPFFYTHTLRGYSQRWNWEGRPLADEIGEVTELPRVIGEVGAEWESWNARLFGERSPADLRVDPGRHDFAESLTAPGVGRTRATLSRLDVSQEVGAHVYRFAAAIRSRYEGLFSLENDSRFYRPAHIPTNEPLVARWKPFFLPCQFHGGLPAPRVQLIVPLTGGTHGETVAPLLVVLSEPWFGYGGLAEILEAEVSQIQDPEDFLPRTQMGPDPILGGEVLQKRSIVPLKVRGPLGHTFDDFDTTVPYFRRTSFLIEPPSDVGITDLSWYFLQVRFRRRLPKETLLSKQSGDVTSPWSQPIWAQLLPNRDRFTDSNTPPTAKINAQGEVVFYPSRPQPSAPDHQLWLLHTRKQYDASGQNDVESFVRFHHIDQPVSEDRTSRDHFRVVELQVHPEILLLEEDKVWERMFPSLKDPADHSIEPSARIVRVLPPYALTMS